MTRNLARRTVFVVIAAALSFTAATRADTFTVTSTADTGAGSLRQAITDANNHAGSDTIAFDIPGSGVQTINVSLTRIARDQLARHDRRDDAAGIRGGSADRAARQPDGSD